MCLDPFIHPLFCRQEASRDKSRQQEESRTHQERCFAYCANSKQDFGKALGTCLPRLPRRNEKSSITQRNHIAGHGQSPVCEVIYQNPYHGLHVHSARLYLHSRQLQGHFLRAGKLE